MRAPARRRRSGRGAAALLGLIVLLLAACSPNTAAGPPPPTPAPDKLHVAVTTTQIRAMAEAVSGGLAQILPLLRSGEDPHAYEPTPSDARLVAEADLVLKHNIGLDRWLDKIIENAGGHARVITVTAGIPLAPGDAQEPAGDPHVWFDVTNAMTMTRNIRDALVAADPANAAAYQANATSYLAQLQDLDAWIKTQIATIPADQRKLVTNHDAFGYYARRYGLTVVGSVVPSMDSSAEPSAQDLAHLITTIRAEHVRAIFLESAINPKLEDLIAQESGVQVVDTLYGDTLGPPGSSAYTYIGMMRYDTDRIVEGLK